MIPKNLRLKKQSAFKATYNVKNSVSDPNFIIFAGKQKKSSDHPTRVGFVVSKKNHKRAVKRNRTKRLMREAYRTALKENLVSNAQNFQSLIITARTGAIDNDFHTIKESILNLINRLKIK